VYIIKHIALTGSSNKKILFTDKFTFLPKKKFELGVIFLFSLVLSKVFDSNFIQNFYSEMVSLVLGDIFLFIFS
jgi:hypothetical protein